MDKANLTEHLRLFIAVPVPDFVKEKIKATQDHLRQSSSHSAVRWTTPGQFHLTLRFLGKVETASVEPLVDSLRTVGQSCPPFQLRAHGVGFFPNARAPRVVWVGVQDSEEERLIPVQQAVQQATLRFTSEEPEQRFSGHITLGRAKNINRQEAAILVEAAGRFSETLFGEWTATEIHVMRSLLSPQGAEHMVLAAVPFSR